jgi:hypothetical protein
MQQSKGKLIDRRFVQTVCEALGIDATNVVGIAIHAGYTGREYVKVYVYMQGDERLLDIAKNALEQGETP